MLTPRYEPSGVHLIIMLPDKSLRWWIEATSNAGILAPTPDLLSSGVDCACTEAMQRASNTRVQVILSRSIVILPGICCWKLVRRGFLYVVDHDDVIQCLAGRDLDADL